MFYISIIDNVVMVLVCLVWLPYALWQTWKWQLHTMAGKELPWFIHFTAFFTGGFKGHSDKHRQQATDILLQVSQLQHIEGLTEEGIQQMRQAYMDAQFNKFANGLLRSVDRCKHL